MTVILPPPDVRSTFYIALWVILRVRLDIVDKTAIFVSKNGKEFEERIYQKERHNPKFSFLNPNDPYHAYYQMSLHQLQEGDDSVVQRMAQDTGPSEETHVATIPEQRLAEAPHEPEPLLFTVDLPNISPLDLDIIKLTALYVARNGRSFQAKIAKKEAGNVQFDFLRPGHSLNRLYQRLVDQYSLVMLPTQPVMSRISDCQEKYGLLDKIMGRVAHTQFVKQEAEKRQADASRERDEIAKINWNDFVVVETLEFSSKDHEIELPLPFDFATITSLSLLERQDLWAGKMLNLPSAGRTRAREAMADVEPATKRTAIQAPTGHEENINVRYDYTPKAAQAATPGDQMVTCSICGQQVLASQIQEHMRIELLDSRWAEQRKAHLAKHTDTNIVESGTDVSRNLAALSRSRTDIFGPGAVPAADGRPSPVQPQQYYAPYPTAMPPQSSAPYYYPYPYGYPPQHPGLYPPPQPGQPPMYPPGQMYPYPPAPGQPPMYPPPPPQQQQPPRPQ